MLRSGRMQRIGMTRLGRVEVSRLIIGGNPFSGFAHQTDERSLEMKHWYTAARIKEALRRAEEIGVNTHVGRADHHIMRVLMEYWDEGGKIQWVAQTCPEVGSMERGVRNAIQGGAVACFLHGGWMDNLFATGRMEEVRPAIDLIKSAGIPAGIAAHNPKVIEWAEANLDLDLYMCSYYNSAHRDKSAELASGMPEWFQAEDRVAMVRTIAGLRRPAIHYKVMAAGRNDPREALDFVAEHLRPQDAVCIGVCTRDKPDMLAEDARILEECLRARGKLPGR